MGRKRFRCSYESPSATPSAPSADGCPQQDLEGFVLDPVDGRLCRMAAKNLRQRAGLAPALGPRTAVIANEIRLRTQKVLRNAASYEKPRY
jgi:hypothetical protein